MNTETTGELVQTAVAGERGAFETLVNRHAAMVAGVAYSRCGDFALSEDIAQEAFIEAWKNLGALREPNKFAGWICTIARRRAIDAVRTTRSERLFRSLDNMHDDVHDQQMLTPEATMSQAEEREWLWSMLSRLPEKYREPLVLFYRCEESTREVAIALGENEETIRQRLTRGREMLRTEFAESMRKSLGATVPKAAFAGLVMASLPSTTCAATVTATSIGTGKLVTSKSIGIGSTSGAAFASSVLGPLIGLLGGAFGSWMSWKNCEYESQQRFIVRQLLWFVIGMAAFLGLLIILIEVRLNGWLDNDWIYGSLLVGLIVGFQLLNVLWIWHGIRDYKRLGAEARIAGEPMRPEIQSRQEEVRRQTRITRSDGNIGYDAFSWNAGGWFGSCIGTTAWMLPLGISSFWFGSTVAGFAISTCFAVGISLAVMGWSLREGIPAYRALQSMIIVMGLLTTIVFAAMQLYANEKTCEYAQWTPWAWFLLLIFPLIVCQFWWTRRSFERRMLKNEPS